MIITLVKADFSANNIGTLSSFNILTNLGSGCTYNGPLYVAKNTALNTNIVVSDAYTFDISKCTITMGSTNINAFSVSGNVISINIANVTGHLVINVPTTLITVTPDIPVEPDVPDEPTYDPDVDYNGTLVAFEMPEEGTWIKNENGSDQKLVQWYSTDYIEIPHNVTTISTPDLMSYRNGTNNTTPLAFYDSNKTYIGGVEGITIQSNYWWRGMLQNYVIPSNAKYVRICWSHQTVAHHEITNDNTSMTGKPEVYWGAMPENKIPVAPEAGDLDTIDGELIDLGTLTEKQWINNLGANQTLTNWYSTDYLEIPEGVNAMSTNDITSYRTSSVKVGTFVFYDDAKTFISCVDETTIPVGSGENAKWRDQLLNYPIPENAKYVRICYSVEKYKHRTTQDNTPISELKVYWISE